MTATMASNNRINVLLCLCFITFIGLTLSVRYDPTWESLDKRPIPKWYDEAKIGIFISWGVFAVPAYIDEWFWSWWKQQNNAQIIDFMKKNYPPGFTYPDFAPELKATFYNPDHWADVIAASGAGYTTFITKHHEGYTLWPSNYSFNWNSMDVGPGRDLTGEFAAALRNRTNVKVGLYHSLFEWFNPFYIKDKASGYKTQNFVQYKSMPCLHELINTYKPDVLWSDGEWEAPSSYWNATEFIAWLYNDSPVKDTIVTNDRWGKETMCIHGDFWTCMDRYNPGKVQKHKWENAMTLDKRSWGYRRDMLISEVLTMKELIATMAETISCGGNLNVNIGITKDGTIPAIFESRLIDMGKWLKVNGFGIYKTKPWTYQNDTITPNVWYTSLKDTDQKINLVFAIVLKWPSSGYLHLGAPTTTSSTVVQMLGYNKPLPWTASTHGGINITVKDVPDDVSMELPWGWVFAMSGLGNAASKFYL